MHGLVSVFYLVDVEWPYNLLTVYWPSEFFAE